jgi:hypothetical protein
VGIAIQERRPSWYLSVSPAYPVAPHQLSRRRDIGISIAAFLDMPIVLGVCVLSLLWVAGTLAICSICAAGGKADAKTEEWYAEHGQTDEPSLHEKKGAA